MAKAYAKLTRTVDKLLKAYGKDCELVHIIPGGYDPFTGTVGEETEVTYTGRAIESGYELEHLAGTLIQAGDKMGMLKITDPSFDGEATLTMKLRFEGDHLRNLREIQPVTPGPVCLYWRFVTGG